MGGNFSITLYQNIVAREVCVDNSSGFFGYVFELKVEGCGTRSITWPNTGCIDLRNCNDPREGDILHPDFVVVTGGSASRPVRYSDFGPKITLTCTGTTGDATCNNVRTEQRDLPNDSCMGGFCYVVVNQERNRDSAQGYCNQKGGSLTSIASQEENEFIQMIANRAYNNQDVTIGGVVSGVPGRSELTEHWLDGTPFEYTN